MYISDILKKNKNNLDFIRLATALMVVWYHSAVHYAGTPPELPIIRPLHIELGHLGVSIFFFISGLLVTNSIITKQNVRSFVCARFFRIYPAYLIMLLICVFLIGPIFTNLSTNAYFKNPQTWEFFFNHLVLQAKGVLPGLWVGHPYEAVNGSLWTIPFEVTLYIIVLTTFVLYKKIKLHYWIIIIPALFMALLPESITWKTLGIGWIFFNRGDLFNFIIGALFAINKDIIKIDTTLIMTLILLNVILYRWQEVIYFLFPITVAIILLFLSTTKPVIYWRLPHDISYGVYIIHAPVIQIIYATLSITSWLYCFALTALITIPLAILSAKYIEEPALRLSKRISSKNIKVPDNAFFVLGILFCAILIAKFCY